MRPKVNGYTLLSSDRLDRIWDFAIQTRDLPGEMAELGTYKGGTAMTMTTACPSKTLHLFDTFEGIPEDDQHGAHKRGEFAATMEEVDEYLKGHRVWFHKGKFPDTTVGFEDLTFSLVHLDADTYQSTKAGLKFFWPRLVAGGVLVLDDLDWRACPGVRRAVEELLPNVTFKVEGQHGWATKLKAGELSEDVFWHHGDQGDIMYALPCIRLLSKDRPIKLRFYHSDTNVREAMTYEKTERLRPLLELQPYIENVEFDNIIGPGMIMDRWRNHPHRPPDNLIDVVCSAFNVPQWDHSKPWLVVDEPVKVAPFVVHRSPRYHQRGYPWKTLLQHKDVCFVGGRDEHRVFCRDYLQVPYHPTPTALDLARAIAGSVCFLGNQSFPLSVAHGLGHTVRVEECPTVPNCHLNRPNAYYKPFQRMKRNK